MKIISIDNSTTAGYSIWEFGKDKPIKVGEIKIDQNKFLDKNGLDGSNFKRAKEYKRQLREQLEKHDIKAIIFEQLQYAKTHYKGRSTYNMKSITIQSQIFGWMFEVADEMGITNLSQIHQSQVDSMLKELFNAPTYTIKTDKNGKERKTKWTTAERKAFLLDLAKRLGLPTLIHREQSSVNSDDVADSLFVYIYFYVVINGKENLWQLNN